MWTRFRNDANPGSRSAAMSGTTGLLGAVAIVWSMALAPASAHEDIAALVQEIVPSVVSIRVELSESNGDGRGSGGSGFLISSDGMIVTNDHVIEGAERIQVEMSTGEFYTAEVLGRDPNTDIALLRIEDGDGEVFPSVTFGNSDDAGVGESVIAIGDPFGLGISVTRGIVSAHNRQLGGSYDDYLQTDAAINFGNSGGPLFNTKGEVIGVNTAIIPSFRGGPSNPREAGSLGIGFAMASNVVRDVVDDLKEFGQVRRGWLGVGIQSITDEIRDAIGIEDLTGTLVADVFEGTPAEKAGIMIGDVITKFNGAEVGGATDLTKLVGQAAPGQEATITVLRQNEELTLTVVLDERDDDAIASLPSRSSLPGMELQEIDPDTRQEYSLDEDVSGVVIAEVDPESQAYERGIRAGSILQRINLTPTNTLRDVNEALAAARESENNSILLLITTEGRTVFVPLEIDR